MLLSSVVVGLTLQPASQSQQEVQILFFVRDLDGANIKGWKRESAERKPQCNDIKSGKEILNDKAAIKAILKSYFVDTVFN